MNWNSAVAFARKVIVTIFILIKTGLFIYRGQHEGSKHRDIQGQTGTDKDRQGQTETSWNKHAQTGIDRDKQGQKEIVPACPFLSLLVPALSLLVPACPCLSLRCPWH